MSDSDDFTPTELERFKKLVKILTFVIIWTEYLLCVAAFVMLFFASTVGYAWVPLLVSILSKTVMVTGFDANIDIALEEVANEHKQ